ncbi:low-affinity phosphate transporter, variant 3 [Bonamia ostreae]|uniref:Low-affinity phosphate transporter, variant 3 n=1 Tax=Bonamia ostreae TaxID=126728 RepID=A0ABV2AT00_9EUKA
MKFGKTIKQEIEYMETWSDKFMSYLELKKQIKNVKNSLEHSRRSQSASNFSETRFDYGSGEKERFFRRIRADIHTVDHFYRKNLSLLRGSLNEIKLELEQETKKESISENDIKAVDRKFLHKSNIKSRLESVYELLAVLQHYCEINATGFRKIVKKWDKVTSERNLSSFMSQILDKTRFKAHFELVCALAEIEALYSRLFMDNDIEATRKHLALLKVNVRLANGKEQSFKIQI